MLLIPIMSRYQPIWAGYVFFLLIGLSILTTFQTLIATLRLADKSTLE
jgi:hypothetical protein